MFHSARQSTITEHVRENCIFDKSKWYPACANRRHQTHLFDSINRENSILKALHVVHSSTRMLCGNIIKKVI